MTESTIILLAMGWLIVLTGSQIISAATLYGIRRRWQLLEHRETELDNAERMERLMDLMQRHRSSLDGEIRRTAVQLVTALENDPLSKEKHFVAIEVLRSKLSQS